jgi:hypothetical protein
MKYIFSESQLRNLIDKEIDERSRTLANTRKKRLFPKNAMMSNPDRFKEYDKEVKNIKEDKTNGFEEFAETRMGGAEKISNNAKEKGGLSMLTYHHFVVKLPYYKKASEGKLNMEDAEKEYKQLLEKLYSSTKKGMNIGQVEFQKLVGKIEVLGELLIKG